MFKSLRSILHTLQYNKRAIVNNVINSKNRARVFLLPSSFLDISVTFFPHKHLPTQNSGQQTWYRAVKIRQQGTTMTFRKNDTNRWLMLNNYYIVLNNEDWRDQHIVLSTATANVSSARPAALQHCSYLQNEESNFCPTGDQQYCPSTTTTKTCIYISLLQILIIAAIYKMFML